jgi:hypothetical protein
VDASPGAEGKDLLGRARGWSSRISAATTTPPVITAPFTSAVAQTLAAERRVCLARLSSWRTAPPVTPSTPAISS